MKLYEVLAICGVASLLVSFACHVMIGGSSELPTRQYWCKVGRAVGVVLGIVLFLYAFQYILDDFGPSG